jgi:signal transduction histidine kinase
MLKHKFYSFLIVCNLVFLSSLNSFSQSKNEIDSINHIPFEQKIKFPKKSIPIFLNIAEDAKSLGYLLGEMEAYENLSLLYYYSGRYDLELEYALKSISGFNQLGDQEKVARFYGELGYRMKRNDIKKAQDYMLKGIKLAEKKTLEKPLMGLYDNYGVLKEMQSQYDSAFYFYQKGLQLKEKFNDLSGIPYSLTNLGGLMVLQKRFDKAKPYFFRALDIRKKLGDTLGICETYLFLSDVNLEQGEFKQALDNLNFVIDHALKKGFYEMLSNAFKKRAVIYEKSGDLKCALKDVRSSMQFKDSLSQQSMRDKLAELQVEFETNEKEKELLNERIKAERFQNWMWFLALLLVTVLLTALSIQFKRTSEKRKLELKNLKDLEFERMRISRDLHDNIGAELTLITSKLDIQAMTSKNIVQQKELNELSALSRGASVLLRETIWSIRQDAIKKADLLEKIESFAKRRADGKLEIKTKILSDQLQFIPSSEALHLYRIAQEAVNNAIKYAGPSEILIEFEFENFKIFDNGKGFDLNNYKPGYGIQNMKQRASEMDAEFIINSGSMGTMITINFNIG